MTTKKVLFHIPGQITFFPVPHQTIRKIFAKIVLCSFIFCKSPNRVLRLQPYTQTSVAALSKKIAVSAQNRCISHNKYVINRKQVCNIARSYRSFTKCLLCIYSILLCTCAQHVFAVIWCSQKKEENK